MPNLTKIAEWAKTVGISRQQGYAAITRCGIPVTDGKVDPQYATHLYETNTRKRANSQAPALPAGGAPSAGPAGAGGGGGQEPPARVQGYDTSRALREAAEASIAQIKLAEMAGKFLLKSDVEAVVFEVARALRDGLSNSARRIAAEVAALPTPEACEDVIDREHTALLENMAHSLQAKLDVDVAEARA